MVTNPGISSFQSFTRNEDYIRTLNGFHIQYTARTDGTEPLVESRFHTIGNTIITFSNVDRAYGSFHFQHYDTTFLGFRFLINGMETFTLKGEQFRLRHNDCHIFNPSDNFSYERCGKTEGITLFLPSYLLISRFPMIERMVSQTIPCEQGIGRLIQTHVTQFEKEIPHCDPDCCDFLLQHTLNLICGWTNRYLKNHETNAKRILFSDMLSFIDDNLQNDQLGLPMIARHFQISTRYVQLLFSKNNMSVSQWIQNKRLQQCKYELMQRTSNITAIAVKWGFCDASYFSRVFKRRYGISPGAFSK